MGKLGDSPNWGVHAVPTAGGLRFRIFAGHGGGPLTAPVHLSTSNSTAADVREIVDLAKNGGTWAQIANLIGALPGGQEIVDDLPQSWRTGFVAGLALVDSLP